MNTPMECPRCSEIELALTDEVLNAEETGGIATYECTNCGHLEVHTTALPSWYRTEKWEDV